MRAFSSLPEPGPLSANFFSTPRLWWGFTSPMSFVENDLVRSAAEIMATADGVTVVARDQSTLSSTARESRRSRLAR